MGPRRDRTPKHARLAAELRRMIRRGRLAVGEAIPTEQALSKSYGCSRGTVRRALDALVNEGLVRRRQGAGHFVARRTANAREALFGLILPNILNAEILRLAQLFMLAAGERGFRMLLGVTGEQPTLERDFVRELHRLKVSGVIKFPTLPEFGDFEPRLRARLRSLGLPYVIVNDFWTDTRQDHHVAFDEVAAVEMAVEHLAGLGHRRIGWLDGSDGPRRRALARLREALAGRGLDLPEEYVLLCPPYERPPVERLWPGGRGPTAVVTPYDGMAVRLIEALHGIGLRVPQDVSVVNLNGQPFYSTAEMDLTTALPPNEEIVRKALDILTQGPAEEAVCQYLLRPGFHAGRTSAPAPDRAPEGRTCVADHHRSMEEVLPC